MPPKPNGGSGSACPSLLVSCRLLSCPRAAFPRRVLAPPNTPTTRAAAVGVNQATIDGLIIHRHRHREWPAGPGPGPDTNPALVVAAVCLSARLDSIALHASPPSLAFCFPRRPVGRSPGPARGPSQGQKRIEERRSGSGSGCRHRSGVRRRRRRGRHARSRGSRHALPGPGPGPGPVRCAAAQASMRQTTRQGKQRPARRRHVIGLGPMDRCARSPVSAARSAALQPGPACLCRALWTSSSRAACRSCQLCEWKKNPLWNDHRQQVSLNLNSNKQSTGAYDMYYHKKKIGYLI